MNKKLIGSMFALMLSTVYVAEANYIAQKSEEDFKIEKTMAQEIKVVKDLDANTKPFVYYNLVNGEIVPAENAKTAKWDIAFSKTTIAVNGGTSGPGQGGAIVLEQPFDKVAEASKGEYRADGEGGFAIPGGSGNSWYNYDMRVHAIVPIAGRTLLIKTAEGKLVKLQIISYYKGAPEEVPTEESSFFTFRYSIADADGKF